MAPFDRHSANTGQIEARAVDFERLAGKALDLRTVTDKAFQPAEADWDGMCAEELKAAPEPVRRAAQETSSALAWAAAPLRYWEGRVTAFNAAVDRISGTLDGGAKDNYGAKGVDGKPPTEQQVADARSTALADARQKWWTAYNTDIVDGAGTAAAMFRDGPTEANLKAARAAGALPATPGVFAVFPAYWHQVNMEAAGRRADELAKKFIDPYYQPTAAELEELRKLVQDYGKDKAFAYTLLTALGPKGLLELNGKLALYNLDTPGATDEHTPLFDEKGATLIRDLQLGLGIVLATATTSTGTRTGPRGEGYTPGKYELSGQWVTDLIAAGRSKIKIGSPDSPLTNVDLFGYQLLGPLLRSGGYDTPFLTRIGSDMIDFEIAQGKNSALWTTNRGDNVRLDWTQGHDKSPAGYDPMTGLMTALYFNPEATRDILTGSVLYDGTTEGGRLTRLDYLLTDREWDPKNDVPFGAEWRYEIDAHGGDYKSQGLELFGAALENATTDKDGDRAEQRRIVESIIFETNIDEDGHSKIGADIIHPEIRDSMANIVKSYIFDVNRNLSDSYSGIPDGALNVKKADLVRFLIDIGKDEGAHKTVSDAEAVFAGTEYAKALQNPEIAGDHKLEALNNISDDYGHVLGALDLGAVTADHDTSAEQDEKHNKEVEDRYAVINFVADQVVGKVTERIPVPGVGDLAGEFVSSALEDAQEKAMVDSSGRSAFEIGNKLGDSRDAVSYLMDSVYYKSGVLDLEGTGLLVDGHPKPREEWTTEDYRAWDKFKRGAGVEVASADNHAAGAYQAGLGWAEATYRHQK
ncbi:hypothetical protein [Actinoplanes cyaneus]|nr:hypothetical protein [Actinoplanes cyaneus]